MEMQLCQSGGQARSECLFSRMKRGVSLSPHLESLESSRTTWTLWVYRTNEQVPS